jgi:uncharacterized membrane protein
MKSLIAASVGAVSVLATGASSAQTGNMMNGASGDMWGGGWMGGYGGLWGPLMLVVVVGLVVWVVLQKRK